MKRPTRLKGLLIVLMTIGTLLFWETGWSQTATVVVGTTTGAPGNTVRVPLTLTVPTGLPAVGGLQIDIVYANNTPVLTAVAFEDSSGVFGFVGQASLITGAPGAGDTVRVIEYPNPALPSLSVLGSGIYLLGKVAYSIGTPPTFPASATLQVTSLEVTDETGTTTINSLSSDGEIRIGVRGDANFDGVLNVQDVVLSIRQIIGIDPLPEPGTITYEIMDVNGDSTINVADVISQVRLILGLPIVLPRMIPQDPVVVTLGDVVTQEDGHQSVPLLLNGSPGIAGIQVNFIFDPEVLQVGVPQLRSDHPNVLIGSEVADGVLRIVAVSLTDQKGLSTDTGSLLMIPVAPVDNSTATLTLGEIILVNHQAQQVPVTLSNATVVVSSSAVPRAFTLGNARPNPFNPSTTIAYKVPQQSHITLTVYNILGQEVVRLVDQAQAPGRYTIVWNGTNALGQTVTSGVYLYRLTSSTGYNQAKRITLLK